MNRFDLDVALASTIRRSARRNGVRVTRVNPDSIHIESRQVRVEIGGTTYVWSCDPATRSLSVQDEYGYDGATYDTVDGAVLHMLRGSPLPNDAADAIRLALYRMQEGPKVHNAGSRMFA